MKIVQRLFAGAHVGVSLLFGGCALALIAFAAMELWQGVNPQHALPTRERFDAVLEAIGILTVAVVALELGQTIVEEEVQRAEHMSAPTRVRRFLSRFMVVIVVSLSIETLVAVFRVIHSDPA